MSNNLHFYNLLWNKFIIVYGEKNSGKTLFLISCIREFLHGEPRTFPRNFQKICYITERNQIKKFHRNLFNQRPIAVSEISGLSELIKSLLACIEEPVDNILLIIDSPQTFMDENLQRIAKILFTIKALANILLFSEKKFIIFLALYENLRTGLPYLWNLLIKYRADLFIRIERVSRVRCIKIKEFDYSLNIARELLAISAIPVNNGLKIFTQQTNICAGKPEVTGQ